MNQVEASLLIGGITIAISLGTVLWKLAMRLSDLDKRLAVLEKPNGYKRIQWRLDDLEARFEFSDKESNARLAVLENRKC